MGPAYIMQVMRARPPQSVAGLVWPLMRVRRIPRPVQARYAAFTIARVEIVIYLGPPRKHSKEHNPPALQRASLRSLRSHDGSP